MAPRTLSSVIDELRAHGIGSAVVSNVIRYENLGRARVANTAFQNANVSAVTLSTDAARIIVVYDGFSAEAVARVVLQTDGEVVRRSPP